MKNFVNVLKDLYPVVPNTAFIVIPFKTPWSYDVTTGIKQVCHLNGIEAKRADAFFNTRKTIAEDIIRGLCQSELVIVDITTHNPNVFYELGMADILGKDIILIRQKDGEEVPSDISNKRYLNYEIYPTTFDKFKRDLGNIIVNIKKDK